MAKKNLKENKITQISAEVVQNDLDDNFFLKKYNNGYDRVIMNPPYGIRLGSEKELEILYKTIGDTLKNKFTDCHAYIFTHNKNLAKCVGLRTKRKMILKNGQLDCRLLYYPIRVGSYS